MRVIAGSHRGRVFAAPSGRDTRPTTDRVREALFSALVSEVGSFEGLHVCDAFAGSGAFGIESLSRGAAHVSFFEKDRKTLGLVKKNLTELSLENRARLTSCDTLKSVGIVAGQGPYDLLFLDPPYKISSCDILSYIDKLIEQDAFCEGCIIVYEHARSESLQESRTLELIKEKKYGDTVVSYLTLKEARA